MPSARAFFRDPIGFAAAHEGRLVRFRAAGRPYVLVREPADVWDVLVRDGAAFAPGKWKRRARRFVGPTLNTLDGAAHAERRALLQPVVARARVDAFAERFAERAEAMAAGWTAGQRIALRRDALDGLSLAMAAEVLLSVRLDDGQARELAGALRELMSRMPRLTPPRLTRARARVDGLLDERLTLRVPTDGDLIAATASLEPPTARGELIAFLLAAVDEPPAALEAFFLLAHDTDEDTEALLRETLRRHPPARHIDRCPVHDVQIAGERVAAGTNVVVSPLVTQHERPEGGRGAYLPFGAGVHACIGEPLARAIMRATLAAILPRWRLRPVTGLPELVVVVEAR